jgi:hypothetical protein
VVGRICGHGLPDGAQVPVVFPSSNRAEVFDRGELSGGVAVSGDHSPRPGAGEHTSGDVIGVGDFLVGRVAFSEQRTGGVVTPGGDIASGGADGAFEGIGDGPNRSAVGGERRTVSYAIVGEAHGIRLAAPLAGGLAAQVALLVLLCAVGEGGGDKASGAGGEGVAGRCDDIAALRICIDLDHAGGLADGGGTVLGFLWRMQVIGVLRHMATSVGGLDGSAHGVGHQG